MVVGNDMAELSRIRVYPIKSLDGVDVESVPVCGSGRMKHDREYALFDADGEYVNGRQNALVHELSSAVDLETGEVALGIHDSDRRFECTLDTLTENPELAAWLSDFFGEPVSVEGATKTNFADSAGGISPMTISATGPTVVSTATLREVASWYEDLDVSDIRRRLRANLEISGVEPFWEDKLFTDKDHAVEFRIGDVTVHGMMSKPRCVVPSRDPDTGELSKEFSKRFVEKRRESFPEWADPDNLGERIGFEAPNYFYVTVVTRVPGTEAGKQFTRGDEVTIGDRIPLKQTL
jgi:uncharacterized protein YcbX